MAQYVIYSGECSICTQEECVFCRFRRKYSEYMVRYIWSSVSFKANVSLLIYCLNDLSIVVSGVLKSTTIMVLLSMTFFMFVKIDLYIWVFSVGCINIYNCCIFLGDRPLNFDIMLFFISCYRIILKSSLSDISMATPAFF